MAMILLFASISIWGGKSDGGIVSIGPLEFRGNDQPGGGIGIGWFKLQELRSNPYISLLFHEMWWFFPLYYLVRNSPQMKLATYNTLMLAFLAIAQASFVTETGPQLSDGNFKWSGKIAWSCLLITGWAIIIDHFKSHNGERVSYYLVTALLILFSLSGAYYIYCVINGIWNL